MPVRPLRFGLVGTGFWARLTHAPALSTTPGVELRAVWGRDPEAARALAARHGATASATLDELFEAVDAVAFAVPPDVQVAIATRAADAGKHLLLEKPVALALRPADDLVRAVEGSAVASVVFFTSRFQEDVRAWLAETAERGGWVGATGIWLGDAFSEGSPFDTPWRREKGGLWDMGPHAVSLAWAALGPVGGVTAVAGMGDVTHLVLQHEGGATSSLTVSIGACEAAAGQEFLIWGSTGRSTAPKERAQARPALRVAAAELVERSRAGTTEHPCDVRFGRDVVRVLAEAEARLS